MEDARPNKRRRGTRSCLACRKAKQRCDLPQDSVIVPSEQPQRIASSCHRCKMLKVPCIITDAAKDMTSARLSSDRLQTSPSRTSSMARQNGRESNRQDEQASISSLHQRDVPGESPHSISHDLQIFEPFAKQTPTGTGASPATSSSNEKNKMTSPAASTQSINARDSLSNLELPSWARHALLAFRPIRLLSELCWRLPAFQSFMRRGSAESNRKDQQAPSSDFLTRYIHKFKDDISLKIFNMRYFLPLIPSLTELREQHKSQFLLTTLCFITSAKGNDRITLEKMVADHALNAILQGALEPEDIDAMVALGLYSPTLLLNRSAGSISQALPGNANGPSLDGLGLFTSAASAAIAADLEFTILSFPRVSASTEHILFLRAASLWLTLGIQAASSSLAGEIKRRPFAECNEYSINNLHAYCCDEKSREAPDSICQSLAKLLIDIFRYRAWTKALLTSKEMILDLSKNQQLEADVVNSWIHQHQNVIQEWRSNKLRELRDDLCNLRNFDDESLEWLDIEISQIYFLSITHLQANLMSSVSYLMAQAASSTDFLQSLLRDRCIMPRFILGGAAHNHAAKRFASLLASFSDRRGDGKSQWAPPPVILCACAVLSAKIGAEEIAGRFHAGHVPISEVDNSMMEVAVVLSRSVARTLSLYSTVDDERLNGTSQDVDIFSASSVVTRRTADAVDEWACTAKALRIAHASSNRQSPLSTLLGPQIQQHGEKVIPEDALLSKDFKASQKGNQNGRATTTTATAGQVYNQIQVGDNLFETVNTESGLNSSFTNGDDLDQLLRDILSTPIDQYLLPDGSI